MKIVVTGGSGFMGSHLVDALVERDHDVTVFDLRESRWLPAKARMVIGTLDDQGVLDSLVRNADVVYHLAGFADLNAARERPLDTVRANIVGTVNLLEAMRRHQVKRFLFASTVYVYSRAGGFYRCSKQACESYIEEYAATFGLRYTMLRYGSLYGPRADRTNGVYRLLASAIRETRVDYTGEPDDQREYIHVEDAARLSADALGSDYENQQLLLTGQSPTRAADLFKMFQEILGHKLEIRYAPSHGHGHYAVTPYAYTPKPGRKLVTNHYVDMGQGLLRMVEDITDEDARD